MPRKRSWKKALAAKQSHAKMDATDSKADVGHVPIDGSSLVPTSVPLVVRGLIPTTITSVSAGVSHVPKPVTAVAGHILATVSKATIIQNSRQMWAMSQ